MRIVPVTLVNIKAIREESNVNVSWNVQNEINIKDYKIERSSDGVHFNEIGTQTANSISSYSYIDNSPLYGNSYYRIKSIGIKGEILYSSIAKISIESTPRISLFPNPIKENENTYLNFENMTLGSYQLRIINCMGQTVYKKVISHNGGNGRYLIDLRKKLTSGNYTAEISEQSGKTKTIIKFLF